MILYYYAEDSRKLLYASFRNRTGKAKGESRWPIVLPCVPELQDGRTVFEKYLRIVYYALAFI